MISLTKTLSARTSFSPSLYCCAATARTVTTTLVLLMAVITPYAYAEQKIDQNATKTAVFAGGCFWCVESDFEKLDGVIEAVSGYTGGEKSTADYKTVTREETGHYEAVKVSYDPKKIDYSQLVEFFWRTIDPTDPDGQFCDKGSSYRTAIFYADDTEREILQNSLADLQKNKPFEDDIVTPLLERQPFYLAEGYHQDYYKKNPIRYKFYRNGCKRDQRLEQLWGED